MKKTKKISLILLILGVFLFIVYSIFCSVFEGILPEKRTIYLSHNSFYKDASEPCFMSSLPKSASRRSYFHRVGFLTYENGYGTIITEEDYENVKKQCLQRKNDYINQMLSHKTINGEEIKRTDEEIATILSYWDLYSMDDNTNQPPNVSTVLEENGVAFFNKLARQDVGEENYHFMWYWIEDDSAKNAFTGSIYNDETHEIIEISYVKWKAGEW